MDSFRSDMEGSAAGKDIAISLSLFIRSDIFATVSSVAREPDKLPVHLIRWPEEADLLEVVGQRYAAAQDREVAPEELWSRFFCQRVGGLPTTDWILSRCLPRPRDVLYLTRAAIDRAVGRRHPRVEEEDLAAAECEYSLFAFEAALVEGQQRIPKIEALLIEFAGAPTQMGDGELAEVLKATGIDAGETEKVREVLLDISFLGIVTGPGECVFTDSPREKQRAEVLLRKRRQGDESLPSYAIHPAFWAYLDLEQDERRLAFHF